LIITIKQPIIDHVCFLLTFVLCTPTLLLLLTHSYEQYELQLSQLQQQVESTKHSNQQQSIGDNKTTELRNMVANVAHDLKTVR
jgi:hypothetical protein